jgi:acyl-CoA synthetase (AMP-forming)/AMP-acid ligase II
MPATLTDLLAQGAADAPAISAPGRAPLAHGALRALIARTLASLNAWGIGRNDRVAIVLPNGPEMATCFMACASGVASAPLNPAYRADEFEFYLSDLQARALIVEQGSTSPAVEVAKKLGVRLIELRAGDAAGDFTLVDASGGVGSGGSGGSAAAQGGFAQPDDVSMVLHTSGTTSRPKIVPLSQANLAASATSIRTTLQFSASDCGLNIMPLFHIHGLIAGVLAPLAAGSQVFCTPGFNALKFFAWMDEARPTWYTAVPTMHQAIIARASKNLEVIARHPLRFMRSSSSSMPPQVIAELEARCSGAADRGLRHDRGHAPDVQQPAAAGRAQARQRGPGRRPRGGDHGRGRHAAAARGHRRDRHPRRQRHQGLREQPKANAEAFTHGWFRTGDQGQMDADGYVSLTGRLKEIINRGGEKVSPREVDEILMDHPAVAQVVCFGMPHPKLGEEVAAAVVLREGQQASERDLQAFVSARVAADSRCRRRS